MKTNRWIPTLLLAAGAWHASAQTAVDLTRQGKVGAGTVLPVPCTIGQLFFKTNASSGANLYACTSTPNGWIAMGLPALAGDAAGTQQAVTVQGIQGRTVSAAAPADQNVLRWNAALGQWVPGMPAASGAAAPPAACSAGSLYLQSDSVNNIQQLYICSNTNSWSMASTRAGLAVNRPANCVAGQTWLSTDTGALTYCAATGNPGTWSAALAGPPGPAGPQGPTGANGNTLLNGSGVPSAGIGANGDFYLNTAAGCLYGPKASGSWPGTCTILSSGANFNGTSGNATLSSSYTALGVTQTSVEPSQSTNPGAGNLQTPLSLDLYMSGLRNPANGGNLAGEYRRQWMFNGHNRTYGDSNDDKKTLSGMLYDTRKFAAGQASGINNYFWHTGVGDGVGQETTVFTSGHSSTGGDEGVLGMGIWLSQSTDVMKVNLTGIARTACNTTFAAALTKSQTYAAPAVPAQVASTTGCNVGDWITADNGVFESSAAGGDRNVDTVQITAVGPGPCPGANCTLSAVWLNSHASGIAIKSAQKLLYSPGWQMQSSNSPGQGRIWIDWNSTPYSTGTAQPNCGSNVTVCGTGTGWTTAMVGGDSNLVGFISFAADDTTINGTTYYAWYPISTVTDGTHLTLGNHQYSGAATAGGAYRIRPGGRVGAIELSYGSAGETISGVVLESNAWFASLPANTTHQVEQIVSPYMGVEGGIQCDNIFYLPGTGGGSCYRSYNIGTRQMNAAFEIQSSDGMDSTTVAGYHNLIQGHANTDSGQILLGGQDLGGVALAMTTRTSGAGDPKKLYWQGQGGSLGTAYVYPDVNTGNFVIDAAGTGKLLLKNSSLNGGSMTLDYSAAAAAGNYTLTTPAASGTMALINPGYLSRTIPHTSSGNNAVDIGVFQADFALSFDVYIEGTGYNTAKHYQFSASYTDAGNAWAIVNPISSSVSDGFDFALEIYSDNSGHYTWRLRRLDSGSADAGVSVYINAIGPRYNFTADSNLTNVSAPSQYWPSALLQQYNGQLTVRGAQGVTASGASCTITAITAGIITGATCN